MNFLKAISALTSILPIITTTIEVVEKLLGAGRGGDKKMAAGAIAKTLIQTYEGFRKDDIVDEKAFSEGVDLVTEGLVKIANSRVKH